jgi:hypothetical protein
MQNGVAGISQFGGQTFEAQRFREAFEKSTWRDLSVTVLSGLHELDNLPGVPCRRYCSSTWRHSCDLPNFLNYPMPPRSSIGSGGANMPSAEKVTFCPAVSGKVRWVLFSVISSRAE